MGNDGSLMYEVERHDEVNVEWDSNGKLNLFVGPCGSTTSFDLARLTLSTLIGSPLPGQHSVGYRDGNKAHTHIKNLYWCGDAPVRGKLEQDDYEEGLRAGAEILWRSAHREFPEDFLAGVNHVLGQDLQSKKD